MGLGYENEPDDCTEDLILTTRNYTGCLRFATTKEGDYRDFERMTIVPEGYVRILDPFYTNIVPKNLLSIGNMIGTDYYMDLVDFQDIRFNCYDAPSSGDNNNPSDSSMGDNTQIVHKNIASGHSGIIQFNSMTPDGTMLLAVTGYNGDSDSDLEFFEDDIGTAYTRPPKGIMIKNYNSFTNIGLGSRPSINTRVQIQGRTADSTKNALKIVNNIDTTIFLVRNDGNVRVNGMLCAKEVMVQLEGTPCWGDYVFNEDYDLIPLNELEKKIKKDKHLPGIPSATALVQNGLQIGQMKTLLLKKIEELTLYIIDLKKENEKINIRLKTIESNKKE